MGRCAKSAFIPQVNFAQLKFDTNVSRSVCGQGTQISKTAAVFKAARCCFILCHLFLSSNQRKDSQQLEIAQEAHLENIRAFDFTKFWCSVESGQFFAVVLFNSFDTMR